MAHYRLFTPGPVDIPEDVIEGMTRPLVYHRSREFGELLSRIRNNLAIILGTRGEIFFFTASGTGAMEAAVVNLLSPGEEVLVAVCGKFGERWLKLSERYNLKTYYLTVNYGESIPPERIEEIIVAHPRITTVFTTLTETSTGALMDIKSIGAITRRLDKTLVVDGIAGLGADEFYMDEWNVDVVVGASQKAFMSPPGISFLAIDSRIWNRVEQARLPRFYWDLISYKKFAGEGQTPFTPAINTLFAFEIGVNKIIKKGLPQVYQHHRGLAEILRSEVKKTGLSIFPASPSNALTVIKIPDGIDGTQIVSYVKERHNILFANGQGDLRGKIVRIGHMGEYTSEDIRMAYNAFVEGCGVVGLKCLR